MKSRAAKGKDEAPSSDTKKKSFGLEEAEAVTLARAATTATGEPVKDDYDKLTRELGLEARGQATDRTKTAEEVEGCDCAVAQFRIEMGPPEALDLRRGRERRRSRRCRTRRARRAKAKRQAEKLDARRSLEEVLMVAIPTTTTKARFCETTESAGRAATTWKVYRPLRSRDTG